MYGQFVSACVICFHWSGYKPDWMSQCSRNNDYVGIFIQDI